MGYLQEADRWLDMLFAGIADGSISVEQAKRDIRSRILESYRNGQKAGGQSPTPRRSEARPFSSQPK